MANIQCPVHGEHANSKGGQCWYCVQSGALPSSQPSKLQSTDLGNRIINLGNRVILAFKGETK